MFIENVIGIHRVSALNGYVLSGLNCLDLVLRSGILICDRNCEVQLGRKKNSKKLRCYMSAPVFIDTHPLEQLFNEIGVRVDNAMATAAAGQSIASVVRTLIQDADFVCGVFPDEGEVNPNVAMEIGMAIGMGRPVFMIKEGDQPLPMSLMDFSYVKSAGWMVIDIVRGLIANPELESILRK